ncbi:thioredoxin family protein [Falsiroseomonas selenitidurans]|uniref:Thioredoxin family protein n=1 Tax=Falsiroseomonas selenitidurans TaxID=2716335 RepID=A0ABX1E265_9PROT|nr:thioredoxin family protein [Falsiroseomonas selenitidurans]NKC29847.1 thioredoxin family protein [Falsiroseomonas selenitidurans]
MHRRTLLAIATGTLLLKVAPAAAAVRQPFTAAGFEAAQAAGLPILIEVFADWCPTCQAQKPHVAAVAADPRMREAVLFTIDFDSQKDALRQLRVRTQSTLIAFRGREERGRAVGITAPDAIRDLLLRAL